MIWVGGLVAGCGQVCHRTAPAPNTRSHLPFLAYPAATSLTPSVWPSYTATPLVTLDSASLTLTPIALYLRASGPTCYETPIGSLICLGQVYNGLQVPVEQVVITVQLHSLDGQALGSGDVFLARTLLPAGLTGPYRILFDRVPEGFGSASASVRSGQLAENTSARYADLRIREIAGTFTNDQYQVSLSIRRKPAAVGGSR